MKAKLITVTADNVDKTGFFCKMSARGKPGYEQKLSWLKDRFAEGLQMRLLGGGERGFVEFTPGAHAWRAIENAEDYMVVHCLWVVGKSKGKGFSTALMDEAEDYARAQGFKGVAAVTSTSHWLIEPGVLEHRGYQSIEQAPPSFDLMVKKFKSRAPKPRFCGDWEKKMKPRRKGLTVFRSGQCPYLDDAANNARAFAEDEGLAFHEVTLKSAKDVRALSPTPYGVYAMVLNGRLLSYFYLLKKQMAAQAKNLTA